MSAADPAAPALTDAQRAEVEVGWACTTCGYHKRSDPGWCAAGCGRDYPEMKRVYVVPEGVWAALLAAGVPAPDSPDDERVCSWCGVAHDPEFAASYREALDRLRAGTTDEAAPEGVVTFDGKQYEVDHAWDSFYRLVPLAPPPDEETAP